jgi:hypothetical protein
MTDRASRLAAGLLAAVLCAGPGCGAPARPAAVPAAGKVTFKKKTPAAGALVVFHPADPEFEKRIGGKPVGKVKDDGMFALTTYEPDDGAPEGEYGVTIDWRGKPKDAKFEVGFGDGKGSGQPLLSPKYGDPQHPAFKVTVKKGQPNEFTFDVD